MHQQNQLGQTTTGGFAAEKPISEIVRNGIEQALRKAGYKSSPENFRLRVTLEDFDLNLVAGYFSAAKVTSTLRISFILEDNRGIKLSKNTVLGRGDLRNNELEGGYPDLVPIAFNKSLEDAITQLVEVVNIEMLQTMRGQ